QGTDFDDDRIGFYRGALSTSSSNVMSIQMDPGGSGMNIEGYWDGVGAADQRPSIVDLTGLLAADSWYRLQTTFTKTAIANEPIIDVTLHAVNGDGSTGALVVSATLDTADLPAGERPHTKYFSGTAYPSYKNHSGGFVDNALAIIDDDTPVPVPPEAHDGHFTATADPRSNHAGFGSTLQAINDLVGGPGAFHVSAGDIDETIPENRAVIDAKFGAAAAWYPGIGNHEEETGADMEWLRAEYDS
ncbi:unnamed protein product, partial [marine sediment metagenome]